ncbi:MAG TPA: protein kinase [Candidatus Acidoferrum sp.]|nr:protein kinase [Candidatus Acidoferrum sp.]
MGLASGTKFGPYEIESPLGAGGMGEVYRARDARLDRSVAIKVLASHLASSPELKQRFEREARALSALNHPNICQLYDIGSQNGTDYLVMEFLEGETLADRLRKGFLPLGEALRIGAEIADALQRAHRAGIVHRDLKPGNVMLTKSGAKLMDFGLAKPSSLDKTAESGSAPLLSAAMTVTGASPVTPLTSAGAIIGTIQYMSPEQIAGQEADARSDIFCLGCILYEMFTGRRAFEGKSQISVASAILEKDPEPIAKFQPLTPTSLEHVVQTCLAKTPDCRWQSAADVANQLRWIGAAGPAAEKMQPAAPTPRWPQNILWGAAVAALLGLLLWSNLREKTGDPPQTIRSFLPPPADTTFDFTGDFSGPPVIRRDGTAIAFSARTEKERDFLWMQSLNDVTPRRLDGTEGAAFPFWSYDGKFIGFFADGHLKKVPAAGGPVTVVADAPNARGGAWNQDNIIIYEPDYRDVLWQVSASGGTPARLTKFDSGKHTTHRWPCFLPDGKHFLFFATNHSGNSEQGIYLGSLADGSFKHILDADSDARYASGYLLYHVQSQLLAVKFDENSGAMSGEPFTLANFVEYDAGTWHTTFAASQNGLLLYEHGTKGLGTELYWMDRTGKTVHAIGDRTFYKGSGRVSPDGKRLAAAMGDPEADIWVFDLARGTRTRLTFGGGTHLMPSWSPDGQHIVYVKQNGNTVFSGTSLRSRLANGGGQEETLMESAPDEGTLMMPQWSSNSRYLLHTEQRGPTGAAVWALPLTGDKKSFIVAKAQAPQGRIIQYRLSPDDRWLAYTCTDSGREEVYVTHFPSGEGRWQVSQGGGTFPTWRGDSKEIYFVGLDAAIHAARVNSQKAEFDVEEVRPLFRVNYTAPIGNAFDNAPDGQHFVITVLPQGVPTPLVVVSNWLAELKK